MRGKEHSSGVVVVALKAEEGEEEEPMRVGVGRCQH